MESKPEYRIVKYYHDFFCRWNYRLEKKRNWKFLWWKGVEWDKVAGNGLTDSIPYDWKELNIIDEITLEV